MKKVFIYGTLKKGKENHQFIKDATFIGEGKTKDKMLLGNGDGFPMVLNHPVANIHGEVYSVDEDMLTKIDQFEGYTYSRKSVKIDMGTHMVSADIYVGNGRMDKWEPTPHKNKY